MFLVATAPQDETAVINMVEKMFVVMTPCLAGNECNVVAAQ